MHDQKLVKHAATMVRLRQRLRMAGSSMISVDPKVIAKMPVSLSQIFTSIEVLDKEISEIDKDLILSGGGGD